MKRLAIFAWTAVIYCSTTSALAQNPAGSTPYINPNGPAVSPYLNLLQSNGQGLPNYQTLVRPMIDQQNALRQQGNSINRLQQQVNAPSPAAMRGPSQAYSNYGNVPRTGHPTTFMNSLHFYPQRMGR